MGSKVTLTASDGFKLGGYRAEAQGASKGALVVIQEIFGVKHHIRAMCDRFTRRARFRLRAFERPEILCVMDCD